MWAKLPADWTVTNAYVQNMWCDWGGWGTFSWSFETSPYEVDIDHPRYHASGDDYCVAYYCLDVTAGGGASADVSWYWDGDGYANAPHHPCSADQYTPASMAIEPCDEWVNPLATVPACGGAGIPWLSESPTSGTVPAGGSVDITVTFDSTGLAPSTHVGNLLVDSDDPDEPLIGVPVEMQVINP